MNIALIARSKMERQSTATDLSHMQGFHIDAPYSAGDVAIRGLSRVKPDVVLLDTDLPDMTGIECLRRLRAILPKCPIVLLTAPPGLEDVSLLECIKAGASGFATKPVSKRELEVLVRWVNTGGFACDHLTIGRLCRLLSLAGNEYAGQTVLTHREDAIMNCVLIGAGDKDIANRLGICAGTVHSHFAKIFKKLRVNSRRDAARKYFQASIPTLVDANSFPLRRAQDNL